MELLSKDTQQPIAVNDSMFDYPFNEGLIHQVMVTYCNHYRSGNSAQKTRAEVRGGGKKPWKQKGTGRARAGSIRSPIWRSGGVTFASKKREYANKINKKMYKRAIWSILSELNRTGNLIILQDFDIDSHKTKAFIQKMRLYDVENALVIKHEITENDYLSSRNLIDFEICDALMVNPAILLKFEKVLITEQGIKDLEEILL